ncbi:ABC-three component system middle component 1 [Pseudobacteroides cellulosolvens]|uniref:Uncharacterized protein n=1 Tax=Pseudobacteroides cellulosolvens ATCC 35603 = DSM 2933 TaxID=398512 RepID=A0A0L6JXF3_9FIRM|nr:ABC-three component system middle component 1 [Pseudobacteroides cellulosolvens]KNY30536.1 hypothetical protein Bccel_5816 [Pseudobacteroides cellulosolvens ATCC 35603 = DSM 2933]
MTETIEIILNQYKYVPEEKIKSKNIRFYKHSDKKIASYFLIYNIDCKEFEKNEDAMKTALETLEIEYSNVDKGRNESLKSKIQATFDNNQEASQIDKNTSAIYLLQFNNLENLERYRNLVYAIEESPNYFKRYIIPYTKPQVDALNKIISDNYGSEINTILSDISDNEDEYYKLLERKNVGSVYELVIRLFSKLPFLQYRFKANPIPLSIEEDIHQKVKSGLKDYHLAIQNQVCSLEELLNLECATTLSDKQLDDELNRLIGGNM